MENFTEDNIKSLLCLGENFRNHSLGLKNKPKYTIRNILEYLRALETHISRIFSEILQYAVYDEKRNKIRYPILESFIKEFFNDQNIFIDNPQIDAECGNIDILIKDKQYVIIIENKINGAPYQEYQPAKYVQKYKCQGRKVFVVLLPKDMNQGEKAYIENIPQWNPAKDSNAIIYSCVGSDTKEDADCYVRALHKNFVEWLSNVIPLIPQNETILISNLVILIEYFYKKYGIILKSSNDMEKTELLKKLLGITDLTDSAFDNLYNHKKQIDELSNEINKLYYNTIKDFMDGCFNEIEDLVANDDERVGEKANWSWRMKDNPLHMGVTIYINKGCINVNIFYNETDQRVSIGIATTNKDKNLTQKNVEAVNEVLNYLGMYEMIFNTQCSEHKSYPLSEARDQIKNLLSRLMEIKYKI